MTELQRADMIAGAARISQMLDVIAQAKQQDGYGLANGFAFEPSFRTRIGGAAGARRSGVYYEKHADHGVVAHTINTGFSAADFNVVAWFLEHGAGFGAPRHTEMPDGCRNLTFANGVSMNFMPFRDNGVSVTLPDAVLPSLQQFQQAGRAQG